MKNKIIFLDVDGVLNWDGTEERVSRFIGISLAHVARFNRIIDAHPDAKIVISSTWRKPVPFVDEYKDFQGLIDFLRKQGLQGEIIGHTPIKMGFIARGQEIKMWLSNNRDEVGEFVVLDDAMDGMAPSYEPKKSSWQTQEEFEEEHADWKEFDVDLRPHHVITSGDGYPGKCICHAAEDVQGWHTPTCDEQIHRWTEGGLQDEHIELAIKVLNGHLIPVAPWKLAE